MILQAFRGGLVKLEKVLYLHYAAQCHGCQNMGSQAKEVAKLLDRDFAMIDIVQEPAYAAKYNVHFPGVIVIDDFQTIFPGTPTEIIKSYHLKGPLPGQHTYTQLPLEKPDTFCPLLEKFNDACSVCIPNPSSLGVAEKKRWFSTLEGASGLVAYKHALPVAAVEWVPATIAPYPQIPQEEHAIFITCLYNSPLAPKDYRLALLQETFSQIRKQGFQKLYIIAGADTPYPNGPVPFLHHAGFEMEAMVGTVLLRHKWEDTYLLSLS